MRLSGLASGFDTDAMVQNLMKVERLKVNRYTRQKQLNLWKQENYNDVNKNIANFILNSKKEVGLNKISSSGGIQNTSFRSLDYVKKAVSFNEDIAKVSVVGKAANGDFNLEVNQLAEKASYHTKALENGTKTKLSQLVDGDTLTISGVELDIDLEEATVDDLIKEINSNDKLKEKGVSAFYDRGTKRLFIQGDATKEDFIQGLKDDENSLNNGKLASVTINGVVIDDLVNNSLEFNGVKIDFTNTTEETGPIRISVDTNTEEIIDRIKGLVDSYNSLLDDLGKVLSEKRHSDFHPLSQEEKNEMTEKDIELWEEKAKSGLLNNDETINRMMSRVRADLYKNVEGLEGSFKHITEIGITTQKYSKGATGGKLQIDEDKLRRAIEADAEGVMELLFGEGKIEGELEDPNRSTTKGIFTGVYDNLIDGMKDIINKSGTGDNSELYRDVRQNMLIDFVSKKGSISDLDRNIAEMDREIANLEVLLARKEDSYYAQFTTMEKYVYEMNSQGNWLMQQMMM